MIIKCTYANEDEVITRFNGTLQEAEAYFLNQVFNIGTDCDNLQKCIKDEYAQGAINKARVKNIVDVEEISEEEYNAGLAKRIAHRGRKEQDNGN